mgnify:CR=1 FL=1
MSINNATAPTDPAHAGVEADLDWEIAVPIVYPQDTVDYQTKGVDKTGTDVVESFLDAIDGSYCPSSFPGQCGAFKPVPVISFSYAIDEADFTIKYINVCTHIHWGSNIHCSNNLHSGNATNS